MHKAMFFIYRVLYFLALLVIVPVEYFKRPKGLRRSWFLERTGRYPVVLSRKAAPSDKTPTVWIHAVSVGETITAISLIRRIIAEITPNIILSTVTDTGRQTAKEKLPDGVEVIYVPFDTLSAVRRAIKAINPAVFIVMETELWPCIFKEMRRENIPVVILNGRISEKSFEGYKKIRFFMKGVLRTVTLFGMQSAQYSERIIAMGADKASVKTLGNFKFDTAPSPVIPPWALRLSHPVLIIGSTHEKEEAIVLSAVKRLMASIGGLSVVLAPRHPRRFDEAGAILKSLDIPFVRRSEITDAPASFVLLDTIGELASVYGVGDVCVMGGSFVPRGGHNLLEPAFWGKPIVCGPHMENFPMVGEFIAAHAAVATDAGRLYEVLFELLSNEAKRVEMGKRASELYQRNSGAISNAIRELKTIIGI
ncbi:MAG: 3-deoxy-D-manno-octulosonic acid transferase [Nitrospirae bacterium]|nr:3-deoxy-D-manno-octulosonic acid transferase [Nitrospirota bacterium]